MSEPNSNIALVIAGNSQQFLDYQRRHPTAQCRHVLERCHVVGFHKARVVRTGTYWENPMNQDDYILALEAELDA